MRVRRPPAATTLESAWRPDETLPSVPVGPRRSLRNYRLSLVAYLWHIVKLIERDDKIAMFFHIKGGGRLEGQRGGERKKERKKEESRGRADSKKKRDIRRKADAKEGARGTESALSGAASPPRRCP